MRSCLPPGMDWLPMGHRLHMAEGTRSTRLYPTARAEHPLFLPRRARPDTGARVDDGYRPQSQQGPEIPADATPCQTHVGPEHRCHDPGSETLSKTFDKTPQNSPLALVGQVAILVE